jgi:putative N-acetylmannosamine-6-phosphate epimerase
VSEPKQHKLPSQSELRKVVKAALEGGAGQVRIETAAMVITATKETAEHVLADPLSKWERKHG